MDDGSGKKDNCQKPKGKSLVTGEIKTKLIDEVDYSSGSKEKEEKKKKKEEKLKEHIKRSMVLDNFASCFDFVSQRIKRILKIFWMVWMRLDHGFNPTGKFF